MRKRVTLALLLVTLTLVIGCGKKTVEADKPLPTPVEIIVFNEEVVEYQPEYSGTVQPDHLIKLGFEVPGRVSYIRVNSGEKVVSGQLLSKLEKDQYQRSADVADAQLQLAERQLVKILDGSSEEEMDALRAQLQEAGSSLAQAERGYQQAEKLFKEGAITSQEYEMAGAQYKAAAEKAAAAEAKLEGAELAMSQIEVARMNAALVHSSLKKTSLFASGNGLVLKRLAEEGEMVAAGQPVLVIGLLDKVKVKVGASSVDLPLISVGLPVEIIFEAYPEEIYTGRVASLPVAAEPTAKTFPLEIEIDNGNGRLKSGMVGRVKFKLGKPSRLSLLPLSAIQKKGEALIVFVLGEDKGRVSERRVSLARIVGDWIEVEGLKEGDQVVTAGASYLNDGDAVRVIGGLAR
ncbi:MAG: efflux RND transporter periplasmic adaptor subunit [Bacillota bacterium]